MSKAPHELLRSCMKKVFILHHGCKMYYLMFYAFYNLIVSRYKWIKCVSDTNLNFFLSEWGCTGRKSKTLIWICIICWVIFERSSRNVKVNWSSCWFVTHQPGKPLWSLSFLSITSEMFGMASDFSLVSSLLAVLVDGRAPEGKSHESESREVLIQPLSAFI